MVQDLCVLIHGFTGSPMELEPLGKTLSADGYAVALPTLHGHAGNKDDMRQANVTSWIQSVDPLVEAALKDSQTVHLIGFSMGALVAAAIAADRPVASLTMLAPAVHYANPKHLFQQAALWMKTAWRRGGLTHVDVRRRMETISQTPLQSVQQFRRMVQYGKKALPRIAIPVCVIQGQRDTLIDPSSADDVFQLVPGPSKEIHYLPDAGHMLCWEAPQEIHRLVSAFLRNVQEGLQP